MKVIVYHSGYGCDTGCCGHVIWVDGEELRGSFTFTHPSGDNLKEWTIDYTKKMIEAKLGPEHTFDLDWENSVIVNDDQC